MKSFLNFTEKQIEQIEELFPIKVLVTKEILEKADISDVHKCIGALTLQSILPKPLNGSWGTRYGTIWSNKGIDRMFYKKSVTTIDCINMMEIKEPIEVTFILK